MKSAEERSETFASRLAILVSMVSLLSLGLQAFSYAILRGPWDDGLMFVRYADHFLSQGALAWNTAPTYGLTSLVQLIPALVLSLVSTSPVLIAVGASIIGAIAFLAAIPFLISSAIPEASRAVRVTVVALIFSALAAGYSSFAPIAASGMDTLLAIAVLAAYLAIALRYPTLSKRGCIAFGIFGGAMYLVRPDLMLFTVGLSIAMLWSAQNKRERQRASGVLFITFGTALLILMLLNLYFGTPLPLPFFAKNALSHTSVLATRLRYEPILELTAFVGAYALLFSAAAAYVIANARLLFSHTHRLMLGILGAGVLSLGYFLFFVVQVMGYDGRFFYPFLPVLIIFSARAGAYAFDRLGSTARTPIIVMLLVIASALLYAPLVSGLENAAYAIGHQRQEVVLFAQGSGLAVFEGNSGSETIWPCLNVIANASGASVATTEVGMPGVVNPGLSVLDLVGLNDTNIALGHQTLPEAIESGHIDLVYLPTEEFYPEERAAILGAPSFLQQYRVFPAATIGALEDVGVRTDSQYAPQLLACLDARQQNGSAAALPSQQYTLSLPYLLLQ